MGSVVQATCRAKLTSSRTGYLPTNGGSKQFPCCKGSFQQEADQKTPRADLIDHQRPAIELSCQASISLLGQSHYRETVLKDLCEEAGGRPAFQSSGWVKVGKYSCDSPENKTIRFALEELLANLGRRGAQWRGERCLTSLWIFIGV